MKKIFSEFKTAYLLLGLLLGLSIGIGVIFVKAASPAESWTTVSAGVSSGQTLTASLWNGLINEVISLQTSVTSLQSSITSLQSSVASLQSSAPMVTNAIYSCPTTNGNGSLAYECNAGACTIPHCDGQLSLFSTCANQQGGVMSCTLVGHMVQ